MAAILPSVPLFPKPPGIRTPVTSFSIGSTLLGLNPLSQFSLN